MRSYRTALLEREFPFLRQLDSRLEDVCDIKIRKADRALLAKKGSEDSYSWSWGGHYDYTHYAAVRVCENTQYQVEWLASAGRSATGSGEHREWDADTLGEQLFAKSLNPDYIVEVAHSDTDDNGNGSEATYWTVFKMKRFDLVAYHQERIDEAAAILKQEIAAACA